MQRLARAHTLVAGQSAEERQAYINNNGGTKWAPLKNRFTAKLGNKCWYTEAELVGAPLTIDHYRPKCTYWFLAFNAENYRVACPFANSPKHNEEKGCAGGKGNEFPLLYPQRRAEDIRSIKHERPVILDPCNNDDCDLIAFLPDGRPVIHPTHVNDPDALERVEKSKLLLNLDHPDFNSKREKLCSDIKTDVKTHEALADGSDQRAAIRGRLRKTISNTAPFSVAARHYLSAYRYFVWVSDILEIGTDR